MISEHFFFSKLFLNKFMSGTFNLGLNLPVQYGKNLFLEPLIAQKQVSVSKWLEFNFIVWLMGRVYY